jgi:hypothetical protein
MLRLEGQNHQSQRRTRVGIQNNQYAQNHQEKIRVVSEPELRFFSDDIMSHHILHDSKIGLEL